MIPIGENQSSKALDSSYRSDGIRMMNGMEYNARNAMESNGMRSINPTEMESLPNKCVVGRCYDDGIRTIDDRQMEQTGDCCTIALAIGMCSDVLLDGTLFNTSSLLVVLVLVLVIRF
mmetsp:Transcript_20114/g.47191  ORF Transcript_20114/g.47191 Transcript_20114/m.47191 type:complete len:118 (-) Transcript_20114:83-436(-)